MKSSQRPAIAAFTLFLGGCGLIGPIIDPSVRTAELKVCGSPGEMAADASAPRDQCFTFQRREADGEQTELLAFVKGTPECSGAFTHATFEGTGSAPGSLNVAVFGAVGLPPHHGAWQWSEPFPDRTFVVPNIGGPFFNPTGATIRMPHEGFTLDRVCFNAY